MIRITTNSFSWNPDYNTTVERNLDGPGICRQAAGCGAQGIEIAPALVTARQLSEIGIALSGASTGGPLFDEWTPRDADKVLEVASGVRKLGGEYVFFTAAPKGGWGADVPVSTENLKVAGERFTQLAERVRAEGIAIGLHNHASTPQGLAAELALLREHVDPAQVGVYLDVAWAFCAGGDPLGLIAEFRGRCVGYHLRNLRADTVPTAGLADGVLDIPAIVRAIVACGHQGWLGLELWHRKDVQSARPMIECQQEAILYLKALL